MPTPRLILPETALSVQSIQGGEIMAEDIRDTTQALDTSSTNGNEQAASPFADIVGYFQKEHPGRFLMDPGKHTINWLFTGDHGSYRLVVHWDQKAQRLLVRVPTITTVPQDKRHATAVLINLINWRLALGNFEMDPSDGEVAFRASIVVADGRLGELQLDAMCFASLFTADRFMPAFQRVIFAEASPEAAFAAVE
jgi:hypothetical protein